MNKIWIALSLGGLTIASLVSARGSVDAPGIPPSEIFFNHDSGSEGGPSTCATGCAALNSDEDVLTETEFTRLLGECAQQPLDSDNLALETLLFYGSQTKAHLAARPGPDVDEGLRQFLKRELARDHVRLEIRVVDSTGVTRISLGPVVVPLGEKQHLHADQAQGFDGPEVSGTLKRVGLGHMWARF